MIEISEKAKEARRAYGREWREKNRDHVRAYAREWRKNNPEKVAAALTRYWERKAADTDTDKCMAESEVKA